MFSYRTRKDGTVAIFWNNRPADGPGRAARRALPRGRPEANAEERQQLMARATGNFKRGNERRKR